MKEATIHCSKTTENCLCTKLGFYWRCLLDDIKKALKKFDPRTWCKKKPFRYRVIHHGYSWMSCPGLRGSTVRWMGSALPYHDIPKYHRCAHLCWLWHPFSQKSEGISKFLTLQLKPWQILASSGDKRLTCLQQRPLSVEPAFCRFVDWTLPPKWIFFRLNKQFHLLRARFQQIPEKTISLSSLSFLTDNKMLTLL